MCVEVEDMLCSGMEVVAATTQTLIAGLSPLSLLAILKPELLSIEWLVVLLLVLLNHFIDHGGDF
jgi:hypothetical protein